MEDCGAMQRELLALDPTYFRLIQEISEYFPSWDAERSDRFEYAWWIQDNLAVEQFTFDVLNTLAAEYLQVSPWIQNQIWPDIPLLESLARGGFTAGRVVAFEIGSGGGANFDGNPSRNEEPSAVG